MIDAPMTAREEALKASHAELLAAHYDLYSMLAPWEHASPNERMRAAIAAQRTAITNAERIA